MFGFLKSAGYPSEQVVDSRGIDQNDGMVILLREQLTAALEREKQAVERGCEREARLLALLEAEQTARCELETKLLSAPRHALVSKVRAWILLAVLVATLVFAGWHFRAVIVSALAS